MDSSVMASLYCGTSGFAYPSWKPAFYPESVPQKRFLAHYATRLSACEINYSFHRLPSQATIGTWLSDTQPGFVFALKAHQRLTHFLRLQRSEFTGVFFQAIDVLRLQRRLGPVLFQLPPNLKCDAELLEQFLLDVPDDLRIAFEFRHDSWFDDRIYGILERRNIALCLAESDKLIVPKRITADFVYFRLRKSEYSEAERQDIFEQTENLLAGGRDVYAFFKHEESPAGALYAEELLQRHQNRANR